MRKRMLDIHPELIDQISDLLSTGVTIQDACDRLGIGESTFHMWRARGRAELDRLSRQKDTATPGKRELDRRAAEQIFVEFAEATTRAEANARINAVVVLRQGMMKGKTVSKTTETFTETRVKQNGETYDYTRTVVRETETENPGDWRAALEYLKRRDAGNWSETIRNEVSNPDGSLIQSGLTGEQLDRAFGSLVDALRTLIPQPMSERDSVVDAGERAAMAGVLQPGG